MSQGTALGPDASGDSARENALLAMRIFMASWALSFVALIGAYLYLRAQAPVWPPDGAPRPPLGLPGVSTATAVLASVVLQRGLTALRAGRRRLFAQSLGLAAAFGVVFLLMQAGVGAQALALGLRPDLNAYAGLFWVTAAFHALHVLVGVVALAVLWSRARRGAYSANDVLLPSLWTTYWHGVDAVWLCIFFAMFVPG